MRVLLIITIAFLMSCQSQQEAKTKNEKRELKEDKVLLVQQKEDSTTVTNTTMPFSFFDSISKKYELSIGQIGTHTTIDSVYYTGMFSDVTFTGDTAFNFYNGLKGAIVDYDDRKSCIYKFLLIFSDYNSNMDNKIIYTDCDHDKSADYTTLHYKLLNDSIFETIETYIPANSYKKTFNKTTKKIKWKLNSKGIIDSIR